MKLTLYSLDFEEETITFRVPNNVLLSNSFGAVPEGVEVDLAPVTGNSALGIKVLPTTDTQQAIPGSTDVSTKIAAILKRHFRTNSGQVDGVWDIQLLYESLRQLQVSP